MITLETIQSFCSKDTGRVAICEPERVCYDSEDYLCATDGHQLLLVPIPEIENEAAGFVRSTKEKFPKIINLLDAFKLQPCAIPISDLLEFCGEPLPKQVCSVCNGTGEVPCKKCNGEKKIEHNCDCEYCEYDEEVECPNCDGEGTDICKACQSNRMENTGKLFHQYFNRDLLRRPLQLMRSEKIFCYQYSVSDHNAIGLLCEESGIKALVMPLSTEGEVDIKATYPKTEQEEME